VSRSRSFLAIGASKMLSGLPSRLPIRRQDASEDVGPAVGDDRLGPDDHGWTLPGSGDRRIVLVARRRGVDLETPRWPTA